jgi:hypothetical protein
MFEIGTIAHGRAEQGKLHPDVQVGVRTIIAHGQVPRVEFNAGQFSVAPLPHKSQSDGDR